MTRLPAPLLSLAILVPTVCGLAIARMRHASRARVWAAGAAALVLGLAAAIAACFGLQGGLLVAPWSLPGSSRAALGVDSLGAPLLPLIALIALITVIARPRRGAAPHTLGALLVTEGLTMGLLTARNLGLLAFFWVASAVPALVEVRRRRKQDIPGALGRTWAVFLLVGALPLLAATLLLWIHGLLAHVEAPLSLDALAQGGLHTRVEVAAGMLIGLAVLLRSAAVPVHGWVPLAFEHGPPGMVSLLWAAQPGAYLLVRVLLPVFSEGAAPFRILLAGLGVLTAVYGALIGLAQTDLKRLIGFLATSHGGMLLVGLASTSAEGIGGALVLWLSSGVALTGLALTAVALEARTGTTDMRALGGLSRPLPRLSTAFLVFGLAAMGLPGMLGFVAEDMLVHGVLTSYPLLAAALLLATMLNGITVMRGFARAFLGQTSLLGVKVPAGRDLRPRERLSVVVLVGILVVLGMTPRSLVSLRADAAAELSAATTTARAPDARPDISSRRLLRP